MQKEEVYARGRRAGDVLVLTGCAVTMTGPAQHDSAAPSASPAETPQSADADVPDSIRAQMRRIEENTNLTFQDMLPDALPEAEGVTFYGRQTAGAETIYLLGEARTAQSAGACGRRADCREPFGEPAAVCGAGRGRRAQTAVFSAGRRSPRLGDRADERAGSCRVEPEVSGLPASLRRGSADACARAGGGFHLLCAGAAPRRYLPHRSGQAGLDVAANAEGDAVERLLHLRRGGYDR